MTTNRKQVALVTGGRSGIGRACARNLASQGIQVFTAQRQDDPEFESICTDLADTDAPRQIIEHVIAHAGQLDILINNAGIMQALCWRRPSRQCRSRTGTERWPLIFAHLFF